MNYTKKTYIALFVLLMGGLIALSVGDSSLVFAKASSKSSSKSTTTSHHSTQPPGGQYRPNSFGKESLNGDCKKVGGYCVAFSTHSCGNFYINGYHYGGSHACSILGVNCSNTKKDNNRGGPSDGANVNFNGTQHTVVTSTAVRSSSASTSTVTSILTRSCTPGAGIDACPPDDLGDIITNFYLNPSYANSETNTCPLFWTPGKETTTSKIICTLDTNGVATTVPTDLKSTGYVNGYPVAPGKHTLICARQLVKTLTDANGDPYDDVSVTEQEAQFNCRAYPQIREI